MMYLIYFGCEFLGMLAHLFIVKLPSMKEKATANNMKFSVADYLKSDWIALVGNMIAGVIVLVLWKIIVGWKPGIEKIDLAFFMLIGFSGSSLVLAAGSKYNKVLMEAINVNANIAQGVRPPVNPSNQDGADKIAQDTTTPPVE